MIALNPTAASLLGFLHHGSMTGWDLARTVDGSIGYFWNVTRSQIYRELGRLEAARLVSQGETGARDKRPFSITAKGREAFAAWLARPPGPELIRFPLLLTIFFGAHLELAEIGGFLATHRVAHVERLAQYRQFLDALGDSDPFGAATVRFGIAYEQAALRWFDSLPWTGERAAVKPKLGPRPRRTRASAASRGRGTVRRGAGVGAPRRSRPR